jgi:hypothetical protein
MGNVLEELKKYIVDNNIFLLSKKLSNKNINLKKEDFNELLIFSCEKNKKEVIDFFYKDNRFDFSYQEILKCGFVESAFRHACRSCSYEVVDLFFKKNVDIFLGKESFLTCAANNDDSRIIEKILQVSRDKKIDLNYNCVLIDQASTPYLGSIKALFNDNRVNPNINKNDFLLTLIFLYKGSLIERKPEILEFILNDTRFSFIPYELKDFRNAYKKIKKDKYILYKLFYSIPELQDDLLFYLQDSLEVFPENIEYLDIIKTMQKINKF